MLLFSFALALFLGLYVGSQLISQKVSVVENSGDVSNGGWFFLYILGATAAMLFVLKYYKGSKLFLVAELFLEFSTLQLLFSLLASNLDTMVLALALVIFRVLKPELKQPLLFLASVTVGALLGSSFDWIPALFLSVLLAGYDYIAVFRSKHMIVLAKELQKREAAFAIEFKLPSVAAKAVEGKRAGKPTRETSASAGGNERGSGAVAGAVKTESIMLGTGDFVVPVMLAVSVLKIGVFAAVMTALGAFVGLSALLFIMNKTKGYYPALPPIVLFSILFYSASFLFA